MGDYQHYLKNEETVALRAVRDLLMITQPVNDRGGLERETKQTC